MKKVLTFFVINLFLVLIQQYFFPVFFSYKYYIDLYLAFSVALFLEEEEDLAFLSSLVGGFVVDIMGTSLVGLSPLILTSLLLVVKFTKRVLYRSWLIRTFLAMCIFFVYMFIKTIDTSRNVEQIVISCLITFVWFSIFKLVINRIFNEERFSR